MVSENLGNGGNQPSFAAPEVQRGEEIDDLSIEYSSSDGELMAESREQWYALVDTVGVLDVHFKSRNDVFVAGDLLVYYRMNDNQARVAPDVFVVFGAAGNHPRDRWLVWREGKGPDFVMGIAAPSTWQWDRSEKRDIYAAMGVTEYWRFDPIGVFFNPQLVAETLVDGRYRPLPMETDHKGVLWCHSPLLGLDVCVKPGLKLRLYDPARRRWLLTHKEIHAALESLNPDRQPSEIARAARREAEAERDGLIQQIRIAQLWR